MRRAGRRSAAEHPGRRSGRRADLVTAVVLGTVVLVFCLPVVGDTVRYALLGASGLTAVVAIVVGSVLHRPAPRLTWRLMPFSGVAFLTGFALRPWSEHQPDPWHHTADAASVSGYLVLLVALVALVRAHGGLRREVVFDVGVATLAGAYASLRLFILPGVGADGVDTTFAVLNGFYPLMDVVLLGLVIDLVITAPNRRSNQFLSAGIVSMLIGDGWFSWSSAHGEFLPPVGVSLFFAVAYLLLAAAAVHPSQSGFRIAARATVPDQAVDAWSPPRLVFLSVSMLVVVILTTVPEAANAHLLHGVGAVVLSGVFALVVLRSVSAVNGQARARAVLQHRASFDALTDLANRQEVERLTVGELDRARSRGRELWLLYLDLDGFKRVNDRWGHTAGDELLRAMADRLRSVAGGSVVGRLSGDEFVVVVAGHEADAAALAQRVLGAVAEPLELSMAEVVVTGSLGMAEVQTGSEVALRDADAAMYRAKAQGRNRFAVFDASMRSDVGAVIDLELALRHAVEQRSFELHYQPVVDIATGRTTGVEALLRWDRPGVGPVSPVVFVPVLEDSGLIVPVGFLVLQEALAQLASWRRDGVVDHAFTVSVNVSPRQLLDHAFPGDVEDLLLVHSLPGECVVLELTESSMLEGDQATLRVLHELRGLGVGLAVDDFGTGYSALSYLRDFPVDRVKIDRSFVSGIGASAGDEEVVRAVVAVSTALGLAVTAEGVETQEQRDALCAMGVANGQGWLWCKALPPTELAPMLAAAHEVRGAATLPGSAG